MIGENEFPLTQESPGEGAPENAVPMYEELELGFDISNSHRTKRKSKHSFALTVPQARKLMFGGNVKTSSGAIIRLNGSNGNLAFEELYRFIEDAEYRKKQDVKIKYDAPDNRLYIFRKKI